MRDAQHLMRLAQPRQPLADRRAAATAQPHVDLVEQQHRHLVPIAQHRLDRQRQPRRLAAARDPLQRPRWRIRVERHEQLDPVHARRVEADLRVVGRRDRPPIDSYADRLEGDLNHRSFEMQRLALLKNRRNEPLGSLAARRAELQRCDLDLSQQRVSRRANLRQISFLTLQLIRLLRRLFAVRDHLRNAVAPATFELGEQREPRLHLGQPCRIDHDHVCVCPQLAQRVRRMLRGGLHRHHSVPPPRHPPQRFAARRPARPRARPTRAQCAPPPSPPAAAPRAPVASVRSAVPPPRRAADPPRRSPTPHAAAAPPDARAPASSPSKASNRRSSACNRRTIPENSSRAPASPANRSSKARHWPGRSSDRCSRCP